MDPSGHAWTMITPCALPGRGTLAAVWRGVIWRCIAVFGAGTVLQSLVLPAALADLPPHCLAKHVVGEWVVHEGLWQPCRHMEGDSKELHDPYCGHSTPDRVGTHGRTASANPPWNSWSHARQDHAKTCKGRPCQAVRAECCSLLQHGRSHSKLCSPSAAGPLSPPNVTDHFRETRTSRLTLHDDFTAAFDDGSTGFWTMVYDEGLHFEVTAPRQRRYFSFFKYELAADGRNAAWSFCHTLMVGWSEHVAFQDSPETTLAQYPPSYGMHHTDAQGCPGATRPIARSFRPKHSN